MNQKYVSAIAFKLFGIYVIVSAVIAMPTIAGTLVFTRNQAYGAEATVLWPAIIALVTIIVAVVLSRVLWKLGDGVLKHSAELEGSGAGLDVHTLERTMFVLLGVYFSVSAIVDVPSAASTIWLRSIAPTGVSLADYAWISSLVVQLAIGLSLIAKLDSWLRLLRNVGVK